MKLRTLLATLLMLFVFATLMFGQVPTTPEQLYFSTHPNYANSPLPQISWSNGVPTVTGGGLRKFVDQLPALGCPANDAGVKCIPVAVPDTTTFPGSDYYEITLGQYLEKMHSDLPPTAIRGYKQTNNGTNQATGLNTVAPPSAFHYLGPVIVARANRAVRVKFINAVPSGTGGNLFIPVDLSSMGAGLNDTGLAYTENRANLHLHGGNTPWISDGTPHQWTVPSAEWRNTSAGTIPGDNVNRGLSVQFVPDMYFDATGKVIPQCSATVLTACSPNALPAGATNDPGKGALSLYWTNQQSARLMFYHDHAYGITRLNVYAGEAAGYVLTDSAEQDMIAGTNASGTNAGLLKALPDIGIPLVIQDKTWVPSNPTSAPLYSVGVLEVGSGYTTANVSFVGGTCSVAPTAVAVPGDYVDPFGQLISGAITAINLVNSGNCSVAPAVQITGDGTGAAAYAYLATLANQDPTWTGHFGTAAADTVNGNGDLWFPHVYMPNQWPTNPDGSGVNPMGRWDYASWFWPVFNNTDYLVRGPIPCNPVTAPLVLDCPGTPSVLNPAGAGMGNGSQGIGSIASLVPEAFMDTPIVNGEAYPTVTLPPQPVRFRILNAANDRSLNLSLFLSCDAGGYTPFAGAVCPTPAASTSPNPLAVGTEVGMVPSAPTAGFPVRWPTDGRAGGVPDPNAAGPSWIQVGTEAGFLPAPAVIPPTPINYEYARRSVTVTNISSKSLFMGPAERADVVVDLTGFANKTLILYNDAPAPVPGFDPRLDYYTGDADESASGGAPMTLPGYGPNIRTIMQIKVSGTPTAGALASGTLLSNLKTLLPVVFKATQPTIIIPQAVYSAVYGTPLTDTYMTLFDYSKTFTPIGGAAPVTITLLDKTIQELFELNYGRMNATLGTELPFTNFNTQTTIPLGYVDPPTEFLTDSSAVASQPVGVLGDGTQIWKVTHNGVDTHAIHFHLVNVQVINRYGWDGTNRPIDPNERGWKETVRMNPLEIDFVALRPIKQSLPFSMPDSIRPFDVTRPVGVTDPDISNVGPTGLAQSQSNDLQNFGQEYVWHCHLLGHEENDMMRAIVFQVAPDAPSNLAAVRLPAGARLTFTNNSAAVVQANATALATGYTLQRDTAATFNSANLVSMNIAPTLGSKVGSVVAYTDATASASLAYFYRVQAYTPNGTSTYSNTAQVVAAPVAGVNPTSLTFAAQLINTTSAAKTVTLSNTGAGVLTNLVFTLSSADFKQTATTCGASVAPGGSCTISIAFSPTVAGTINQTLKIASNDPVNPTLTVNLTGTVLTPAAILTPTPGSVLGTTNVVFTWSAGTGPNLYQLLVGTTGAGSSNLYSSGNLATLTATVPAIPAGALPVNVRLLSRINGVWSFIDYTYTESGTPTPAAMITPVAGSKLAGTSVTFTWSAGVAVTGYQLQVGTTGVGASNVYASGIITATTTATVTVPANALPVYVRLFSRINGVWSYVDYTYTEAGTPTAAALLTPVAGTLLGSTNVVFTWNTGVGVTAYQLVLGTTGVGSSNVYSSGTLGTTTATVPTITATAGTRIYVRLFSRINGVWQSVDYTYTKQ